MGCGATKQVAPIPHAGKGLVIGCTGAGKTVLMRQLEAASFGRAAGALVGRSPQPTVGTELLELKHPLCSFSLREMGGAMLPLWPRYFAACRILIFVADTSSAEATGAAVVEWYNALDAGALAGKPMLLILNQRDREGALSEEMVRHLFRFSELETTGRQFAVRWTSAVTGDGVREVLQWCAGAAGGVRAASKGLASGDG
jgi:GTPase SAR1 family protein